MMERTAKSWSSAMVLGAALSLVSASLAASDWPGWRGPGRDGVVQGEPPAKWPASLKEVWRLEVGEGHASPVVVGSRIFAFTREGEEEVVRAIDLASGKALWRKTCPAPYEPAAVAASHGKGPKATPVAGGGRLFTLGIGGILSAFDAASGDLLWRKELSKEFPRTSPLYGTASSPLLEGELLVAQVGGHDKGALRAFDARTGETRWSVDIEGPGYSSPVAMDLAGERQAVMQTQGRCLGVSLKSGKVLWSVPFRTEYDQNSVTPLHAGGLVVISGVNAATAALRLERSGDGIAAREAWRSAEAPMYMSSPVLSGKLLVGHTHKGKGRLFALDPATGKTLWQDEGRRGENAALLAWGPLVLALTTDAKLLVLRPSAERLETVAEHTVAPSPTWAHPVVVGKRILVKDRTALAALSFED